MPDGKPTDWVKDIMRWSQINIRVNEAQTMDVDWWGKYLKRCGVGALIINAGGSVAYFPSEVEQAYISPWLGDRDLLGEIVQMCRAQNIRVLGRFTLSAAKPEVFYEHPDWFAIQPDGKFFVDDLGNRRPCINSPYHWEYALKMIDEVMQKYDLDGIFANQWFGVTLSVTDEFQPGGICVCEHCQKLFRAEYGVPIPTQANWNDRIWKEYIQWRVRRAVAWHKMITDHIHSIKPSATFIVNQWGSLTGEIANGADHYLIGQQQDILTLESQSRTDKNPDETPLWWTAESGKFMRACGHGKPYAILYGVTYTQRRRQAVPPNEITITQAEMVASGTRPWFHAVGAVPEDRRSLEAIAEFYESCQAREQSLRDITSVANVGLVYSLNSQLYYGQNKPRERYIHHFRGMYYALLRAGIPFDLVHERDLTNMDVLKKYKVLAMGNVACMSNDACASIRAWARGGGKVVATFLTSLFDEWGVRRENFGLAEAMGVDYAGPVMGPDHDLSCMRIEDSGVEWLQGFGETDFLPNGDFYATIKMHEGGKSLLALIPPIPRMPPEWTFPQQPDVHLPLATRSANGSYYFAADIDKYLYERDVQDFSHLLGGAVNEAVGTLPVKLVSPGLVDVQPYMQTTENALVVQLVNLSNPNLWKGAVYENQPVGPVTLEIDVPAGKTIKEMQFLRLGAKSSFGTSARGAHVTLPVLTDYETLWVQLQ